MKFGNVSKFKSKWSNQLKTKKSSVKTVKSKKGGRGVSAGRFKPAKSKSGGSSY